jgi:hypothetical protein
LTSVLLISNGSSWFLLSDVYLITIVIKNIAGCELHPSDQAMKCPVFTPRRYMWSSWRVFRGDGLGMFSHKPIFAIFAPPIFAFVLCSQRMNNFVKTPDLNTHI